MFTFEYLTINKVITDSNYLIVHIILEIKTYFANVNLNYSFTIIKVRTTFYLALHFEKVVRYLHHH